MDELTKLIAAVRKYRALERAHAARWGEGNAWMHRSRPTAKDWDEYNASNSALVAAHGEVFRAALALRRRRTGRNRRQRECSAGRQRRAELIAELSCWRVYSAA